MSAETDFALSRPFLVDDLKEEAKMDVEADASECAAMAERLNVLSVDGLAGSLRLTREIGAVIRLHGSVKAELTQACVVTLVPVKTTVSLEMDRRYGPPELVVEADDDEDDIPFDDDDPPDVIEAGVIDVGDAVVEQLALEIDPFLRADGAEFEGYSSGPVGADAVKSPFAALEVLVKKPK